MLFGANVANAQPVFMKYLFLARKRGAKVAVVNPLREPGLDRYWVPSNVESAMFGTHMTDEFFAVHTGGDLAFLNGVLKVMLAEGAIDRDFVREHTDGIRRRSSTSSTRESFADLERQSGATRADMERFARMYASANAAVLVWSMGITQHEHGADNVAAIVNLGLARGNVGRPGAGLMPIRGHSGVQGGAEMGAYATALPGGLEVNAANAAALAEQYGFTVGDRPGITAEEMVEAGGRGELDVLYSSRRQLPRRAARSRRGRGGAGRGAGARAPGHRRVEPDARRSGRGGRAASGGDALRAARRRHRDHHRTADRVQPRDRRAAAGRGAQRVGDLRRPRRAGSIPTAAELMTFASGQAIRDEIARVVPMYAGVERLRTTGDAVQWGGTRLCEGGVFPTADGRARFLAVAPSVPDVPHGSFVLSTRRGKQFNTMVHTERDPLTGATRDALFMAPADIDAARAARR